jgi:hypothetical protein
MEPFFTTKDSAWVWADLSLYHAIAQDNGGTLTLCKDSKNTCFRLILRLNPNSANQRVDGTSSEAVTNETKGRRWPRNDGFAILSANARACSRDKSGLSR